MIFTTGAQRHGKAGSFLGKEKESLLRLSPAMKSGIGGSLLGFVSVVIF
jgi:hypothetical protein